MIYLVYRLGEPGRLTIARNSVAFFEYHAIACTSEKDRMVALMTFASTVDEDFLNDQSTL
jgi:hypothetical protein